MAMRENVVIVEGNLTRDPEAKTLPSGTTLAEFGLAQNEGWTDSQGERQERTNFYDVTVWNGQSENVVESLSSGDRVVIVGRLKLDQWENDAGEKRSKLRITADSVSVCLRWATVESVTRVKRGSAAPSSSGPSDTDKYADEDF